MTAIPPRMALAGFIPVNVPKGARRSAMLRPKPKAGRGHIPALDAGQLAWLAGELGPDERKAMRQLCATADLYDVNGTPMLIAPATPELLDTLAAFEAEGEDREDDLCDEPQDVDDDRDSDNAFDSGGLHGQPYTDDHEHDYS